MAGVRLLFVTGEYPPMVGGISDYTGHLARVLAERGVDVGVLTHLDAVAAGTFSDSSIAMHAVPGWSMLDLPLIKETIESLQPDLIHLQYQTAAFDLGAAICVLPKLLRMPTVTTFHDVREPYLFPKAGGLRRRANAALARWSRAVICTNAADRESVIALGQPDVSVIPLGNNVPLDPPPNYERGTWRRALAVDPGATLIGHFGLMGATKGIDTLLDALELLPECRLVFIGAGEGAADPNNRTARNEALIQIERRGLSERVTWTGRCTARELSAHLLACDVLVLPYDEGASFRRTTLVAALAHGVPVITTSPPDGARAFEAVDGLPDLRSCEELLLVPPGNPRALASAAKTLLADRSRAAQIGEAGRQAAKAFDWTRVSDRHVDLYRTILE